MEERQNPKFLAAFRQHGRRPDVYAVRGIENLSARRAMALARLLALSTSRPVTVDALWLHGHHTVRVLFATIMPNERVAMEKQDAHE